MVWITDGAIPITEIGPGDQIEWTIRCSNVPLTGFPEIWEYQDMLSMIQPHPSNPTTFPGGIVPFTYTFLQSSCECDDVINNKYDQYEFMVTLTPACNAQGVPNVIPPLVNYSQLTWDGVTEPMNPNFNTSPICAGENVTFLNTSTKVLYFSLNDSPFFLSLDFLSLEEIYQEIIINGDCVKEVRLLLELRNWLNGVCEFDPRSGQPNPLGNSTLTKKIVKQWLNSGWAIIEQSLSSGI